MRRPPSVSKLAPALLAGLGLAAALAAGPAVAGSMTVAVDHTVKLSLMGPAGSVVVGNPAVADVTVVDSRSVFVSGRGPGTTDVTVVDPLGRTVFAGDVRVVSEPGAHVVIHRGSLTRAELSCDPSCIPSANTAATAGPGPSAAPSPAGVMANAVGGAVAGAATGAVSALTAPAHPS